MNASEKPTRIPVAEIDLNADLGEGLLNDQALLGLVTSASICCGAHAGSSQAIRRTLCDARDREVVIGAHPGYPDRDGFGRRDQDLSAEQVEILITGQVSALGSLAAKPASRFAISNLMEALYNQAQCQEPIARGVVAAAAALNLPLLGQPGALVERDAVSAVYATSPRGFRTAAIATIARSGPGASRVRSSSSPRSSRSRFCGWWPKDGSRRCAFTVTIPAPLPTPSSCAAYSRTTG